MVMAIPTVTVAVLTINELTPYIIVSGFSISIFKINYFAAPYESTFEISFI